MPRRIIVFLLLTIVLASAASAQAAAILRTAIEQKGGKEFIVLFTDVPVRHQKVFLLASPDRLVVDLDSVGGQGVAMPAGYRGLIVRGVRFGRFDEDTSRIVVDMAVPARKASLHHFSAMGGQPERIVIELEPGRSGGGGLAAVAANARKAYPVPQAKPQPPASLKPVIVIDAGHGGKDPGAQGRSGAREKGITLSYALALRKELLRTGRYDVVLTRETDEFILLHDRVKIGRHAKGSVFVSLHADSAPGSKTARGLSIYTLSETASDEEAAALAAQENKSDVIDGLDLGEDVDEDVAGILIDLAQRETKNKSAQLADQMVKRFREQGIRLLPNTHRYAGFRVLKAPDVPSVLVEIGFISNPEEERLIKTDAYRARVLRGVIYGLDTYFEK